MKRIALETIAATMPPSILYGRVTQINPLVVSADQRLTLPEDFLIVPEHLTEHKITIDITEYTIRRGLEIGDSVILLRQQGGLNYIILGRMEL
jgi:hypothetical protein